MSAVNTPSVSRPYIPGYGVPKSKKGMLAWDWVDEQMKKAAVYWIATVSPEGHPHAIPLWGVWVENKLYFGGGEKTRHMRNLKTNPHVVVHLESGQEVVIMEGLVEAVKFADMDPSLNKRLEEESIRKYGAYGEGEGANFAVIPRKVLAWTASLSDATRFIFE